MAKSDTVKNINTYISEGGFFKNIGIDVNSYFSSMVKNSSNNQFWAAKWNRDYTWWVEDNYLYIQSIDNDKHIGRFDLIRGLFWQALMNNVQNPKDIKIRWEPEFGQRVLRIFCDGFRFSINLHPSFNLYMLDSVGYEKFGIDKKHYHSKGWCSGSDSTDGITDRKLIDEFIAYEKLK